MPVLGSSETGALDTRPHSSCRLAPPSRWRQQNTCFPGTRINETGKFRRFNAVIAPTLRELFLPTALSGHDYEKNFDNVISCKAELQIHTHNSHFLSNFLTP